MKTNKITYKTITPKELKKYQAGLLELLKSEYNTPKELLKSFKNTDYIVLALDGDKVIGSNQIITDKHYVAFFVNLWVKEEYRKDGIGGKIIENTIKQAKKLKVKWIELIPDPSHPWLVDFYVKYGFKEGICMSLRGK